MWKAGIKPGVEYALREKPGVGKPVERVRILKHIRGNKWRAEWIDTHPGLVDFVESSQLLVRWRELKAFLEEEAAADALKRHNAEAGCRNNSPLDGALHCVFESVGEKVRYWKGTLTASPEVIERLKTRAKLPPAAPSRYRFTDRSGIVHLPFEDAIAIAKGFAGAEPSTVLISIEATERSCLGGHFKSGHSWTVQNRPLPPAAETGEFYFAAASVRKSVWSFVRQLRGPHLSTCA
jgi:hypothetical protein